MVSCAVVFDLDDVLYPELDYVESGFRAVAGWAEARLGVDGDTCLEGFQRLFAAGERGRVFDAWLERYGLSAVWASEMVAVYREHDPSIRPAAGAPALLDRLRDRFRLGLVSDGPLAVQRRKWAALDMAERFGAVCFTDALGRERWKPCPDGYRLVLDELGVAPGRAVYVGDNPAKDFLGARRAGLRSVRLRRAGGVYAALEPESAEHAPDLEIDALDRLESALETLGLSAERDED